jgi:hypothetical protein
MQARSTVFSLLVWLTQMTWWTSASVYLSTCCGTAVQRWACARGAGRASQQHE